MKIIFLDIDGVLNHEAFYRERHQRVMNGEKINHPYSEIDTKCVDNLNKLIEDTDAKVVISSTWRHSGIDYCRDVLEYHGFKGEIIDITPNLRGQGCLRGNEILQWIRDNHALVGDYYNFTEYVILDDDSDMLYWQRNNFLLIDRFVGLTMGNVFHAKKILNNGKILNVGEL